jgi:hypothetical protein
MKIDYNQTIQYTILFLFPFLLILYHNWLISHIKPKSDQQLVVIHDTKEKIILSLALFIGTMLFMLYLAPSLSHLFLNGYGLFAIAFAFLSSFLIILFFLSTLLKEIKCQSLFFNFFINRHFWLSLFFIVATELLVLYWLKEIDIYIQDQFLVFLVGYSLNIFGCGIFLGITKQSWQTFHKNRYDFAVAIIDPLIVVFFALCLIQILLKVFYHIL